MLKHLYVNVKTKAMNLGESMIGAGMGKVEEGRGYKIRWIGNRGWEVDL